MNLNPKTEHLKKWQKGQPSPNPYGRKPKFNSLLKSQGYSHSEIKDSLLTMLAMSKNELLEMITNENLTILEETIAKVLLEGAKKRNLQPIEFVLNKSFGTTKEKIDIIDIHSKYKVTLNLNNK